jgi:hypothetical protein
MIESKKFVEEIKNIGRSLTDIAKDISLPIIKKIAGNDRLRLYFWTLALATIVTIKKHQDMDQAENQI